MSEYTNVKCAQCGEVFALSSAHLHACTLTPERVEAIARRVLTGERIMHCVYCQRQIVGEAHLCRAAEERVREIFREVHDERVKRLVSEVENVRQARDEALDSAIEAIKGLKGRA